MFRKYHLFFPKKRFCKLSNDIFPLYEWVSYISNDICSFHWFMCIIQMIYSRYTSATAIYQFIYAHFIGLCVLYKMIYSHYTSAAAIYQFIYAHSIGLCVLYKMIYSRYTSATAIYQFIYTHFIVVAIIYQSTIIRFIC